MEAAIAKVFPGPRLFDVKTSSAEPTGLNQHIQFCMGPDFILKFAGMFRDHPEATAALTKGCTHVRDRRPDGSGHLEISCDKAAGAFETYRMVADISPGMAGIRQHMEMELDLGSGKKTVTQDLAMTLEGDCPADLKSGQMRMQDGTIFDGGALLGGAAKSASPAASPAK